MEISETELKKLVWHAVRNIVKSKNLLYLQEDLEDIVQEVYVSIYKHKDKYDPQKACFSTWVYMLAKTTVVFYNKRKQRWNNVTLLENILPDTTNNNCYFPEENILEEEFISYLKNNLSKSGNKILNYYLTKTGNYSIKDILEETNISKATYCLQRRKIYNLYLNWEKKNV